MICYFKTINNYKNVFKCLEHDTGIFISDIDLLTSAFELSTIKMLKNADDQTFNSELTAPETLPAVKVTPLKLGRR